MRVELILAAFKVKVTENNEMEIDKDYIST